MIFIGIILLLLFVNSIMGNEAYCGNQIFYTNDEDSLISYVLQRDYIIDYNNDQWFNYKVHIGVDTILKFQFLLMLIISIIGLISYAIIYYANKKSDNNRIIINIVFCIITVNVVTLIESICIYAYNMVNINKQAGTDEKKEYNTTIFIIILVTAIISTCIFCLIMKIGSMKYKLKEKDIVISPLTKNPSNDPKTNKKNKNKGKEPCSDDNEPLDINSVSENNDGRSLFQDQSNRNDNIIDIHSLSPSINTAREIPMNPINTNLGVALTETNENINNNNTFINNSNTIQVQNPNNVDNIDVNSLLAHLDYLHNYILTNIPNQNQIILPSYGNINNDVDPNANNIEQQQQQQELEQEQQPTININENNVCSILPSYSQLLRQHFARNSSNITSNNDDNNKNSTWMKNVLNKKLQTKIF